MLNKIYTVSRHINTENGNNYRKLIMNVSNLAKKCQPKYHNVIVRTRKLILFSVNMQKYFISQDLPLNCYKIIKFFRP